MKVSGRLVNVGSYCISVNRRKSQVTFLPTNRGGDSQAGLPPPTQPKREQITQKCLHVFLTLMHKLWP